MFEGMLFVSGFGDSAVLLPASIALFVYLHVAETLEVAALWARALVLCLLCVAVIKVLGYVLFGPRLGFGPGSGLELTDADVVLVSASGHAAFAALFYTALWVVARMRLALWLHVPLYVGTVSAILAIAGSRLVVGGHTPLEIVAGTILGLVFALVFARDLAKNIGDAAGAWGRYAVVLMLLCGAKIIVVFTQDASTEGVVQGVASVLGESIARWR